MRGVCLIGVLASLTLAACHPVAGDSPGSHPTPPADAPADAPSDAPASSTAG